jgi:hypothetical protein
VAEWCIEASPGIEPDVAAPSDRGARCSSGARPVQAVQITRFGGPEVLDVIDVPEPMATTVGSSSTSPPPASTTPTRTTAPADSEAASAR